jgi:hypothetical protein
MHLRDLIVVMVLGYQGAIQVICQVSILIGWAKGVCCFNAAFVLMNKRM